MIKRGLTFVNAMHITANVFINDDESGLHHDYEVWLQRLTPHAPIEQAGPEAAGPRTGGTTAPARFIPRGTREQRRRAPETAGYGPRRAAVVVVTDGRPSGHPHGGFRQ